MEKQEENNIEPQEQWIKTALIVEDNLICQRILQSQLSKLRYHVDLANDGQTAIKKLRENAYHLIVTDLGLPDIAGNAIIQTVRHYELNQGTPLIVASAQINEPDFNTYLELGADAILIKPFSIRALDNAINECFLMPAYKRKFPFQIHALLRDFDKKKSIPKNNLELQSFISSLQSLMSKALRILQEYQQWCDFEKLKSTHERK